MYDLVCSQPVTEVAKELGISDVAPKKISRLLGPKKRRESRSIMTPISSFRRCWQRHPMRWLTTIQETVVEFPLTAFVEIATPVTDRD
jgi:hypothetical protein